MVGISIEIFIILLSLSSVYFYLTFWIKNDKNMVIGFLYSIFFAIFSEIFIIQNFKIYLFHIHFPSLISHHFNQSTINNSSSSNNNNKRKGRNKIELNPLRSIPFYPNRYILSFYLIFHLIISSHSSISSHFLYHFI